MGFRVGDRVKMGKLTGVVALIDSGFTYGLEVIWDDDQGVSWFLLDGRAAQTHKHPALELVERPKRKVKKEIVRWVNVYPIGVGAAHGTKIEADAEAFEDRIACVEVKGEYEVEE